MKLVSHARLTTICALLLLLHGSAAAQTRATEVRPTLEAPDAWYGWQTLTADGASAAALALGAVADRGSAIRVPFAMTGGLGYALAAPVVHLVHGRSGVAAGDLGLRLGLPIFLGLAGYGVGVMSVPIPVCAPQGQGVPGFAGTAMSCGAAGAQAEASRLLFALIGAAVGAGGAVVADATLLARVKAPVQGGRAVAVEWAPVLSMAKDAASAGVAGTF